MPSHERPAMASEAEERMRAVLLRVKEDLEGALTKREMNGMGVGATLPHQLDAFTPSALCYLRRLIRDALGDDNGK